MKIKYTEEEANGKSFFKHYHSGPLFMRWFGLKCVGKGREKKAHGKSAQHPNHAALGKLGAFYISLGYHAVIWV